MEVIVLNGFLFLHLYTLLGRVGDGSLPKIKRAAPGIKRSPIRLLIAVLTDWEGITWILEFVPFRGNPLGSIVITKTLEIFFSTLGPTFDLVGSQETPAMVYIGKRLY